MTIKEVSVLAHLYTCVASGKVLSPFIGSGLNDQIKETVAADPTNINHVTLQLISLDLWTEEGLSHKLNDSQNLTYKGFSEYFEGKATQNQQFGIDLNGSKEKICGQISSLQDSITANELSWLPKVSERVIEFHRVVKNKIVN